MPRDTVTFKVSGELTMEDFARTVRRFTDLVMALNKDTADADDLEWMLADVQFGSLAATAQARPKAGKEWSDDLRRGAEQVTDSYLEVGRALEAQTPIPGSDRVDEEARRIRDLTEKIETITFETLVDDITIENVPEPHPLPDYARAYARGAVEGRVQALTNRGSLRFTLYDTLYDRAVSCYMVEGRQDQMKDLWGRLVVVEGLVRRDPRTGRPQTVRSVQNITTLREPEPDIHRRARGAALREQGQMRSEDAIRRVRDA